MLATLMAIAGAGEAVAGTLQGSAGALDYYADSTFTVPAPGTSNATAECVGRTVGGGIYPTGPTGEAYVTSTYGGAGTSGGKPAGTWYGKFVNVAGANKSANVFLVCTSRKAKTLRGGGVVAAPGQSREYRVRCPTGTHVAGGGGQINGYNGFLVRLVSSYPFDSGDRGKAPDDGWAARFYNGSDSKQRFLVAAAHCLAADGVLTYSTTTSGPTYCSADQHVTGGGLKQRKADAPDAWIHHTGPLDTGDIGGVPDDGWAAAGRDTSSALKAYAICMG